jgi:hypothetical protein
MRALENANFAEQKNSDARAFGFGNFRAQTFEKRLDVAPSNVARNRSGENLFERFPMLAFY